jgi:hypothetical protein
MPIDFGQKIWYNKKIAKTRLDAPVIEPSIISHFSPVVKPFGEKILHKSRCQDLCKT